jgi:alkylhydroperoxidase family enzyme
MPGIRGLLAYRPETAGPLMALAQTLLRGDSTLTAGERELIAATAAALLPDGGAQVDAVLDGPTSEAPVSAKLRALLDIAGLVQADGRLVTDEAVAAARAEGATDLEIHDTVLIAAAFCMFNRYVDGLATSVPDDPAQYAASAAHLIAHGYLTPR